MRLIDADALSKDIQAHCGPCGEAIECVLNAPTICRNNEVNMEVRPLVHAKKKKIYFIHDPLSFLYICSNCGLIIPLESSEYCCHCGAKFNIFEER